MYLFWNVHFVDFVGALLQFSFHLRFMHRTASIYNWLHIVKFESVYHPSTSHWRLAWWAHYRCNWEQSNNHFHHLDRIDQFWASKYIVHIDPFYHIQISNLTSIPYSVHKPLKHTSTRPWVSHLPLTNSATSHCFSSSLSSKVSSDNSSIKTGSPNESAAHP